MANTPTKMAAAAAKRAQASQARQPKSTAKALEEQTAEIELKIAKVLERQQTSAAEAHEEVGDLIEALQKSHHKEKLEAKRLPAANQSHIRDLEYKIKKLQEDCDAKQGLLAKHEKSRAGLKAERMELRQIIQDQQSGVIDAKQNQMRAEAALAPTKERLETLNSLGVSVHSYVITRVMELRRLRKAHEVADLDDKMLSERLEREYNDTTLGLFDGWDRMEHEYMKTTKRGEFPPVAAAQPDANDAGETTKDGFMNDARKKRVKSSDRMNESSEDNIDHVMRRLDGSKQQEEGSDGSMSIIFMGDGVSINGRTTNAGATRRHSESRKDADSRAMVEAETTDIAGEDDNEEAASTLLGSHHNHSDQSPERSLKRKYDQE